MDKKRFEQYIQKGEFVELFNELGWNHGGERYSVLVDETEFEMRSVAEKQGFIVWVCEVQEIPRPQKYRKIDQKLKKTSNDYILVFVSKEEPLHHLWLVPVKTVEKRVPVAVEYAALSQTAFLFSKMQELSFGISESVTIVDVTERVQKAFEVNSEKVTKDFYAGFKKQHDGFAKFISGISVEGDRQWYVSVMLNRLMFCYFIQKKGFLNFDEDYLRHKLVWSREQRGKDKFFGSFYKGFLRQLFFGGLNSPDHDSKEFIEVYGRIPYLNGGMFDTHQIEREYKDIDIADEAFENLFDFFDKYKWHLDTRIEASGKDINPDVLGYIFEQYINDRAQMGAYYTKEDITEYIGKNCILPFLLDATAKKSPAVFSKNGEIWTFLKASGDKYIYASAKKGLDLPLPQNIEIGVDTQKPDLLERRTDWNTPTPAEYGLPTEIWRETVERRRRCAELKAKIEAGEIKSVNDFITHNLDIRGFVQDFLLQTDDHLFVRHFYEELRSVSILDPTCGSGAFLFAALNILEPLYEACIERMQEFNAKNKNLFAEELAEITNKYRSNIQYFIYKSIILRNLYGVDIMAEAAEIAKLRLFLKMVAVVEADRRAENLGLDPLPDIDFNIRSGNTLVGYANQEEVLEDLESDLLGVEFEKDIKDRLQKVAMASEQFKRIQLSQGSDIASFKRAKEELAKRLSELNDILNSRLYGKRSDMSYGQWLKAYRPFNWLSEYYAIVHERGGFDVIIGNPPYVEYSKVKKQYTLTGYKTLDCGNLYAFVFERCMNMVRTESRTGMIVQLPIVCTDRMISAQDILSENASWIATFDDRPGKLFDNLEHIRATIFLTQKNGARKLFSTRYNRWYSETRNTLFQNLEFINATTEKGFIPKVGTANAVSVFNKIVSQKRTLSLFSAKGNNLYFHNAPQYFTRVTDFVPYFWNEKDGEKTSVSIKIFSANAKFKDVILATLNSSLFYFWFIVCSDCRHLNSREIDNFYFNMDSIDKDLLQKINHLSKELMDDYRKNAFRKNCFYKATGNVSYDEYYPAKSKPIIDKIDALLARHYGFTQEELDFIINYDIKYRMGAELEE